MRTRIIEENEYRDITVGAMPTRPTVPKAYGGGGYTASTVKSAFDRLPLFIIDRLNMLIEDIASQGSDSICTEIKTGLAEGHTLSQMLLEIKSGIFSEYLKVADETLAAFYERLSLELEDIKERINTLEQSN